VRVVQPGYGGEGIRGLILFIAVLGLFLGSVVQGYSPGWSACRRWMDTEAIVCNLLAGNLLAITKDGVLTPSIRLRIYRRPY
jgi:hypothetical protein